MNKYIPSSTQAITNWLCGMLFLVISLIFPFLIAITYHEKVTQKTMHIALGMFFLTVATSVRNLFIFFFLLALSIYMFSAYGAYKEADYVAFDKDIYSLTGFLTFFTMIIAAVEKWHQHIQKGEPFLPFDKSRFS